MNRRALSEIVREGDVFKVQTFSTPRSEVDIFYAHGMDNGHLVLTDLRRSSPHDTNERFGVLVGELRNHKKMMSGVSPEIAQQAHEHADLITHAARDRFDVAVYEPGPMYKHCLPFVFSFRGNTFPFGGYECRVTPEYTCEMRFSRVHLTGLDELGNFGFGVNFVTAEADRDHFHIPDSPFDAEKYEGFLEQAQEFGFSLPNLQSAVQKGNITLRRAMSHGHAEDEEFFYAHAELSNQSREPDTCLADAYRQTKRQILQLKKAVMAKTPS